MALTRCKVAVRAPLTKHDCFFIEDRRFCQHFLEELAGEGPYWPPVILPSHRRSKPSPRAPPRPISRQAAELR